MPSVWLCTLHIIDHSCNGTLFFCRQVSSILHQFKTQVRKGCNKIIVIRIHHLQGLFWFCAQTVLWVTLLKCPLICQCTVILRCNFLICGYPSVALSLWVQASKITKWFTPEIWSLVQLATILSQFKKLKIWLSHTLFVSWSVTQHEILLLRNFHNFLLWVKGV